MLLVASVTVVVAQDGAPPPRIAVLAREDVPIDALGASAVIARLGGVVFVTTPEQLGEAARQGLIDYDPELVVLAGGVEALFPAVEDDVRRLGFEVRRVGGETRSETARLLVELLESYGPAYLAVDGTAENARTLNGMTLDEVIEAANSEGGGEPGEPGPTGPVGPAGPPGSAGSTGPLLVILP